MGQNPLQKFIDKNGFVLLDGGLSTELEKGGHDLNHKLWSARFIEENPGALQKAHLAFLEAGADVIISSSYQASMHGLLENGFDKAKAIQLLKKSYTIASQCCDSFYSNCEEKSQRLKPLAAASIGPYGAYLADGAEYRGVYDFSAKEILAFHRERFEILAGCADLLAIETIPSLVEAKALKQLIAENEDIFCWVSFTCKDEKHLAEGQRLSEAAALFADLPQVVAVGVNCTKPKFIASLISEVKNACGEKEIVIYPNRGEDYCSQRKTWVANEDGCDLKLLAPQWLKQGARIIGGCCRVSEDDLVRMRQGLMAD